jgi:hypothetical protein
MVSVPGPTRSSCVRVRRGAPAERGGRSAGPGHCSAGVPFPACCTRGRVRDLTGFLAIRPMPLPCSKTPAEPTRPRLSRSCRHRPRPTQAEGPSGYIISRLTHGFSIRCLRFTNGVTAAHARLASGWRAAPLPGGGRTLWIALKGFRLHSILLSRTSPVARVDNANRRARGQQFVCLKVIDLTILIASGKRDL